MAEISQPATGQKASGGNRKKLSTRVDLTPMVDLGFILITFFIFTTTMSEPSAMKLIMPAEGGDDTPVKASNTITIIPGSDNKAFCYPGILAEALAAGSYTTAGYDFANGIGAVIRKKKSEMEQREQNSSGLLMVVIKPTAGATYQNVVDILDEMTINAVKSYAITEIEQDEIRAAALTQVQ